MRCKHGVALTPQGTFLLSAVIESLTTLSAACTRLAATRKILKLARSVLPEHDLATGKLVCLSGVSVLSEDSYFAICLPEALRRPEVTLFMDWLAGASREGH